MAHCGSSHVNITAAIQIFTDHKIWNIKEEADSSATNQAYDQLVTKKDKARMRPLVDVVSRLHGVIDQFKLITSMVQALKNGDPQDWVRSFMSVNMHPKHRLPFEDWLRKIATCIQTSDAAFKKEVGSMTIFDAMPTFWKA